MERVIKTIFFFLLPMFGVAGDWEISGEYYSREQALSAAVVRSGVVLMAREVKIEPSDETKVASTTVGAALGGVLSHAAFGKKGGIINSILSSGIGGILGGIAGSTAAGAFFASRGCEVIVKLDDGETVAVVQKEDRCPYPGQRVDLVTTWGKTRVVAR